MNSTFISIKDAAELIGVSEASYRRGMANWSPEEDQTRGSTRSCE